VFGAEGQGDWPQGLRWPSICAIQGGDNDDVVSPTEAKGGNRRGEIGSNQNEWGDRPWPPGGLGMCDHVYVNACRGSEPEHRVQNVAVFSNHKWAIHVRTLLVFTSERAARISRCGRRFVALWTIHRRIRQVP
jgi:hypothetical protein